MKTLQVNWRIDIREKDIVDMNGVSTILIQDLPQVEDDIVENEEMPETHEHIETFEIVNEIPFNEEDQEVAHGGNDSVMEVEDAPEREEAAGVEESLSEIEVYEKPEPTEDTGDKKKEKPSNKKVFELELLKNKRLSNAFANIISKVAEDLEGQPTIGDDEWDIEALLQRKVSRKSINDCRMTQEKKSVVIILDTSGSCYSQAKMYSELAKASQARGDVELYDAPNGLVRQKFINKKWEYDNTNWWQMKNRTIIFFGDFDGGNAPVIASKNKNKVYWFSPESRYRDMDEHSWCNYTLQDFKGKYIACKNEKDFFKSVKKIR